MSMPFSQEQDAQFYFTPHFHLQYGTQPKLSKLDWLTAGSIVSGFQNTTPPPPHILSGI